MNGRTWTGTEQTYSVWLHMPYLKEQMEVTVKQILV